MPIASSVDRHIADGRLRCIDGWAKVQMSVFLDDLELD